MKPIKYTEAVIKAKAQAAYDAMVKQLTLGAVACHGKDKGTPVEQKVRVSISEKVYCASQALVDRCDKEIAWYCTARKIDDLLYMVDDIVGVPPQEVSGTTVDCPDDEFMQWLLSVDGDTVNQMRCHCHSHVNMSVFSSGTDDDFQKDMVGQTQDFYIFLIFNKKGEIYCRVYDIANDVMYEDEDIELYLGDAYTWIDWADAMIEANVTTKQYKPATQNTHAGGYTRGGSFGYWGAYPGYDYD